MTAVDTDLDYRTNGKHRTSDRETTAERLLRSSAKLSFDPAVDIDWDRPHEAGKWYMQPERLSLYGTPLWEEMTPEQQVDLSRHEVASIAATGIFFEMVLMRMLLKHLGKHDAQSKHFQYGLTEVADECHHSTMFGRMIEWLGVPSYGPGNKVRRLAEIMQTPVINEAIAFGGTYYVEAVLDAIQREGATDERVQDICRRVSYIHVVEEARHMRYADEELARTMDGMGFLDRQRTRLLLPLVATVCNEILIHPRVYANVGLDVDRARAEAAANPYWQETIRWAARKPMGIFREQGLLDGPAILAWKRMGLA